MRETGPTSLPEESSGARWDSASFFAGSLFNSAAGQLTGSDRSNPGTFIGAVCFLVGALLLLSERTDGAEPEVRRR